MNIKIIKCLLEIYLEITIFTKKKSDFILFSEVPYHRRTLQQELYLVIV